MKRNPSDTNLLNRLSRNRRSLLRQLGHFADELGLSIYLVGGVVRDLLLKRKIGDLDVTVEGDGIAFAQAVADRYGAGLALFERFGTARLVFPGGLKLDIASTRRESYAEPAQLPDVMPASLNEDLYRRDFTINAMAVQLNAGHWGRLHDSYGGQRDLKAKRIRVLHERSFVDDPTRIFRAIRFARRFGFALEPRTRRLLKESAAAKLIDQLSGPRLRHEILLLLRECGPEQPIKSLVRLNLLQFLSPRLRYTTSVRAVVATLPRALDWWKKHSSDRSVDRALVYLMTLLSQASPAVLRAVSRRLQMSSLQSHAIDWAGQKTGRLVQRLEKDDAMPPSKVYRLLFSVPDEALVVMIAKGRAGGTVASVKQLARRLLRFLTQDRRVKIVSTGNDLKRLGLKPGPQFKTMLDRVLNARLDGEVRTASEERALLRRLAEGS